MGRYVAGTRTKEGSRNKKGCGFCKKDGFGNCQYLFQEKR